MHAQTPVFTHRHTGILVIPACTQKSSTFRTGRGPTLQVHAYQDQEHRPSPSPPPLAPPPQA